MFNPEVAIIMSVYMNDEPSQLQECLNSILIQSYDNWHIFLLADGPISIGLRNVIDSFVIDNNEKITYIERNINLGLATTLNELISLALSNKSIIYFARMDADDINIRERLELQVQYMEKNKNIDILGGGCYEFGSEFSKSTKKMPLTHKELEKKIFLQCPFIHPTVMFRRNVFESGERYPVNFPLTEDLAFWFQLLRKGYVFGNITQELIYYRLLQSSLKRRRGIKKAILELSVRLRYQIILRRLSPIDFLYSIAHFALRVLPERAFCLLYKKLR